MDKKIWLIIGLLVLLLIVGVWQISKSSYTGNTIINGLKGNVISDNREVTCNPPYIKVGDSCCLDQNYNNVCDNDEQPTQQIQQDCQIKYLTYGNPPFSTSYHCTDSEGSVTVRANRFCEDNIIKKESVSCIQNKCRVEKTIIKNCYDYGSEWLCGMEDDFGNTYCTDLKLKEDFFE